MHPGVADTDITRHMSFYSSWLASLLVKPFIWPFIKSPKQGAQTIIYLAIDERVNALTGKYFKYELIYFSDLIFSNNFFSNYDQVAYTEVAEDDKTAKWLWAVSEKWTKLNEPPI